LSGRIAFEIILLLLLVSTPILLGGIHRVEASLSTFHIRADGSVEPATHLIERIGNQYVLTGDIQTKVDNDGIVIERDNMILEGAGHSIYGMTLFSYTRGVQVQGKNNVTVRNIRIDSFYYGVGIVNSSGITISGCSLADNWDQIEFRASTRNSVLFNTLAGSDKGIALYDSSSSIIRGNNIEDSNCSVLLVQSYGCTVVKNSIDGNLQNAICLSGSSGNTIEGNIVEANLGDGVLLDSSSNNRIYENRIVNNQKSGVVLWDASDSIAVVGNNITSNNQCGILISGTSGLRGSRNCTISRNNIVANGECGFKMTGSSGNRISKNDLVRNAFGLELNGSLNNLFCQNNIIDNTNQVSNVLSRDAWDNGVVGNYWSQYTGEDLDKDGIADHPYSLDSEIIDNYPLVHPYRLADVNHDGKINIVDITLVVRSYGAVLSDNNGRRVADLDENGRVDIADITIVAVAFGKEWNYP
jgi:parallel beta-helix repeat protein